MEQTEAPEEPTNSLSAPVPASTADNRFNHGGQSRVAQRNEPCSQQAHWLEGSVGVASFPYTWDNRPQEMGRYYTEHKGYLWDSSGRREVVYTGIHPNRGH